MLAEFIDRIAELAKKSTAPSVIQDLDPRTAYVTFNGELREFTIPPPARAHELEGLADVVSAARDKLMASEPEVYHNELFLVVLLDRSDRRERVTVKLDRSNRFERLISLEREPAIFDVRAAVKFLRYDLHATGAERIIQGINRIEFNRSSSGKVSAAHGKESLGRSVEAAAQGATEIPEGFTVTLPIYTNPGLRFQATLECGIYVDLEREAIEIRVFADEIARALSQVQAEIGKALRSALPDVPIFNGTP